jgi:ADP-heptose:LPS heptosyltransferase
MAASKKILVIKTGALGDFIQALGPMRAIRKYHPDANITLLTTEPFAGFGKACGYFDDIWLDPRPGWNNPAAWLAWRRKLIGGDFTRVYDLQNNDRTELYLHLMGRRRVEWVGAARGASHRNPSKTRSAGQAFDGHIETLGLVGINDIKIDPMDWVAGDVSRFNLRKPYILLVPGCAPAHPEKRWPAEKYGTLAQVTDSWGFQPVIIGTAADSASADMICRLWPNSVNLTGETALLDIVLLARQASAAFGNDTGPMHMIAATGCPVWVFFSRKTNPIRHAPKGNVHIIRKDNLNELDIGEVKAQVKPDDFRR